LADTSVSLADFPVKVQQYMQGLGLPTAQLETAGASELDRYMAIINGDGFSAGIGHKVSKTAIVVNLRLWSGHD